MYLIYCYINFYHHFRVKIGQSTFFPSDVSTQKLNTLFSQEQVVSTVEMKCDVNACWGKIMQPTFNIYLSSLTNWGNVCVCLQFQVSSSSQEGSHSTSSDTDSTSNQTNSVDDLDPVTPHRISRSEFASGIFSFMFYLISVLP